MLALTGLGPVRPSKYYVYLRRPARGTLLRRACRDVVWHRYFPTGYCHLPILTCTAWISSEVAPMYSRITFHSNLVIF